MPIYHIKTIGRKLVSCEITRKWSTLQDPKTGESYEEQVVLNRSTGITDIIVRAHSEAEAKEKAKVLLPKR